jgi:hypothetical protein
MRDRLIVAAGALVVSLVLAWPALSRAAGWNRPEPPVLERAVVPPELAGLGRGEPASERNRTDSARCIEPVAFMRASHMTLLGDWRDLAVRRGVRSYQAADGREFEISLSRTCLGCHQDKTKFCDRCHDYAAASPACWDCHVAPAPGGPR